MAAEYEFSLKQDFSKECESQERGQRANPEYERKFFRNSLSCGKAASKRIPGSIHKYVTGVSERSQRIHSSKYEEKKSQRRLAK